MKDKKLTNLVINKLIKIKKWYLLNNSKSLNGKIGVITKLNIKIKINILILINWQSAEALLNIEIKYNIII